MEIDLDAIELDDDVVNYFEQTFINAGLDEDMPDVSFPDGILLPPTPFAPTPPAPVTTAAANSARSAAAPAAPHAFAQQPGQHAAGADAASEVEEAPGPRARNRAAQSRYRERKKQEIAALAATIKDRLHSLATATSHATELRNRHTNALARYATLGSELILTQRKIKALDSNPTAASHNTPALRLDANSQTSRSPRTLQPSHSTSSSLVSKAHTQTRRVIEAGDLPIALSPGYFQSSVALTLDLLCAHVAAVAAPDSSPTHETVLHDLDTHLQTYRAAAAARAGCTAEAVCLYLQLPYEAAPGCTVSCGSITADMPCFVAWCLTHELLTLETKLVNEQLKMLGCDVPDLTLHDPRTVPASGPDPFAADPVSLNGLPIPEIDEGEEMLISCNVAERVPLPHAVEYVLNTLFQRYQAYLPDAVMLRVCDTFMRAMMSMSAEDPSGLQLLSATEREVMMKIMKSAGAVMRCVFIVQQQWIATFKEQSRAAVPRVLAQLSLPQVLKRARELRNYGRMLSYTTQTAAGRLPQTIHMAHLPPEAKDIGAVETVNLRMFNSLNVTGEQMQQMSQLWEEWTEQRRSFRHQLRAAAASLSRLPRASSIPCDWLLLLGQLSRPPRPHPTQMAPPMATTDYPNYFAAPVDPLGVGPAGQQLLPMGAATQGLPVAAESRMVFGASLAWCQALLGASAWATEAVRGMLQNLRELQRQDNCMHTLMQVRVQLPVFGLTMEQHVGLMVVNREEPLVDVMRVVQLAAQGWQRSARFPLHAL